MTNTNIAFTKAEILKGITELEGSIRFNREMFLQTGSGFHAERIAKNESRITELKKKMDESIVDTISFDVAI